MYTNSQQCQIIRWFKAGPVAPEFHYKIVKWHIWQMEQMNDHAGQTILRGAGGEYCFTSSAFILLILQNILIYYSSFKHVKADFEIVICYNI